MRIIRAPTVRPGDRITAQWANQVAAAVNGGIEAPRDLDTGVQPEEVSVRTFTEESRSSVDVRVENPEDEEQYVIVTRAQVSNMYDSRNGETVSFLWLNT